MTLISAGRVGKPHGRDGSFYVERPDDLPEGTGAEVTLAGDRRRIERRGGTADRPLLKVEGLDDRDAVAALRGEALLVDGELESGEWLAHELVGCEVEGLGRVERVVAAPSCDLLELDDGALVPLVADAVVAVDVQRRRIEVDRDFLGVE